MRTIVKLRFVCLVAAALASAIFVNPVIAHHDTDAVLAPVAPPSDTAPIETVTGTLDELLVENKVTNTSTRYVALQRADGAYIALNGSTLNVFTKGAVVEASGRRSGNTLFVVSARALPSSGNTTPAVTKSQQATGQAMQAEGTLLLAHADEFATGQSLYMLNVRSASGVTKSLKLPLLPDTLQAGMSVVAIGSLAEDGFSIRASHVIITALAPPDEHDPKRETGKDVTTNNVLVVLIKFSDSPADAFTPAQVQQVMSTNANSVRAYYNEASYGQHLLNVTVTNWLTYAGATPANCDYDTIESDANTAAATAGYNVTNSPSSSGAYQNIYYVFPSQSACGWAGLGYIGYGVAFSNGYNLLPVFAHELGHNFGLLHAASLRCSGSAITAGSSGCSSSEYGDPFSVMGDQGSSSVAMHFNAKQKSKLNWIPPSSVATYVSGTSTYTLTPIETSGGTTYAVKVAAFGSRTYWLEYRQPIGQFDSAFSYPNNGAQIRIANPFESLCPGCADDSELLDMTPGTTGSDFHDAALLVGQSYTDSAYGITMSVLSATASALTVQVSSGIPSARRSDFDGDGKSDVLWRRTSDGLVQMWTMNGASLTTATNVGTGTDWSVVATGDFDGDGKSDIVWRQASTGLIQMWLMNGATLVSATNVGSGTDWSIAGAGDFNGDGRTDLVLRRASDGLVQLWLMNGASIVSTSTFTNGTDWFVAGIGDFNGDGKADILWRQASTGLVQMWFMNGGGVTSAANVGSGTDWSIAGVGDFNGDGKSDILWRRASDGLVQMWLMNGANATATINVGSGTDWLVAGVGDFNGDGKSDLLWRQGSSGIVQMWLMNGGTISASSNIGSGTNWSIAAPR